MFNWALFWNVQLMLRHGWTVCMWLGSHWVLPHRHIVITFCFYSPRSTLTSIPIQLCVFYTQQIPFTFPIHSEISGIQWKMFSLWGAITLKKTDSVSFSSYQLSITPLLVVRLHLHPSPFHTWILSGSSLCGPYACSCNSHEFMFAAALLCLRNTLSLKYPLSLGLTTFSASLMQWSLSLWRRGVILMFHLELATTFYFLYSEYF